MKKYEFELTDGVYEEWKKYKEKHGHKHDSGAFHHLLNELRYSEEDILTLISQSIMAIVACNIELSETQKEIETRLSWALCVCEDCQKGKNLAHTNKMGFVGVSKSRFNFMLSREHFFGFGIFDIIHSCLHEALHNLYPRATEKSVQIKTEKFFRKGVIELSKMARRTRQ